MNIDKAIAIADALGWETEHNKVVSVISVYTSALDPFRMRTDLYSHDFIAFAAVAKAEMAKRGITITPIYAQHETWDFPKWCMRAWKGAGDVICLFNDYDPTDPISEANALIDAISAALEMETTT